MKKIKVTCACGDEVTEREELENQIELRLRYLVFYHVE
jgi:hypothetical protein